MPIGVFINTAAVVLGGFLGSLFGDRLSEDLKATMTSVFGVCAMTMGISSIILMKNMPAVIFSVIVGTMIGCLIDVNGAIRRGVGKALSSLHMGENGDPGLMIVAVVLFCASGTGIYGSLTSGMTGDHSILIAKSILDLFTSMIFACRLKRSVMLIAIPQCIIMCLLFFSARLILPLTDEVMIADFKACGGVILLATGFSIMKVKEIAVANMLPAMLIVMTASYLWTTVILPLM